eukprot:TRINITY_DN72994_c0_g1_i1.p1 TRINITY_DN72994_c0_g1~~TRINITY_DN72994_c0_g1_i1.p1  ORF type:complete len:806 (-),score=179.91 TRINITY_DN72994_c0_g1_i1:209-2626(-)
MSSLGSPISSLHGVSSPRRAATGTPFALRLEDLTVSGNPKIVDEKQWKQDCVDLHQVMGAAQQVYMLLSQSNEAVLRVALSIASCRRARRVLWWNDGWWSDGDCREVFKHLVGLKLDEICAAFRPFGGSNAQASSKESAAAANAASARDELKARVEELEDRLRRQEKCRHEAGLALQEAQANVDELERKVTAATRRAETAEQGAERLRSELRQATQDAQDGQGGAEAARRRVAELEKQLSDAENRAAEAGAGSLRAQDLGAKLAAAEALLSSSVQRSDHDQVVRDLSDARSRIQDLERQDAQRREELARLEARASAAANQKMPDTSAISASAAAEAAAKYEKELAKLREETDAALADVECSRRLAQESADTEAAARATAEAEVEKLRSLLADALGEAASSAHAAEAAKAAAAAAAAAAEAEAKRRPANPEPMLAAPVEAASVPDLRPEVQRQARELEEASARCAKLESRLEKQRTVASELGTEKAALEEKLMRALTTLNKLKEQLKSLQALAERRGCGQLVQDIMEESDVQRALDSEEFSIFGRLYEDALRRQEKQRQYAANLIGSPGNTAATGAFGGARVLLQAPIGVGETYGTQPVAGSIARCAQQRTFFGMGARESVAARGAATLSGGLGSWSSGFGPEGLEASRSAPSLLAARHAPKQSMLASNNSVAEGTAACLSMARASRAVGVASGVKDAGEASPVTALGSRSLAAGAGLLGAGGRASLATGLPLPSSELAFGGASGSGPLRRGRYGGAVNIAAATTSSGFKFRPYDPRGGSGAEPARGWAKAASEALNGLVVYGEGA